MVSGALTLNEASGEARPQIEQGRAHRRRQPWRAIIKPSHKAKPAKCGQTMPVNAYQTYT